MATITITNPETDDVLIQTICDSCGEEGHSTHATMRYSIARETACWDVEIADDIANADAYLAAARTGAVIATEIADATCRRCVGTGQFITRMENGVPKGPGGICYRCAGKGVITAADHRRNNFHDDNCDCWNH